MTPGHVGAAYPRPIMFRSVRPPSALCSSSASSESIGISTPTCTLRQRKRVVSKKEETTDQRALFPRPISTALCRNSFKRMKTHSLFIVSKQRFCSYKPFCVSKTSDFHAFCNWLLKLNSNKIKLKVFYQNNDEEYYALSYPHDSMIIPCKWMDEKRGFSFGHVTTVCR